MIRSFSHVLIPAVFLFACHAVPLDEEKREEEHPRGQEFRALQRQGGSGAQSPFTLVDAKRQRDRLRAARRSLLGEAAGSQAAAFAPDPWTWIGPGNIGGRIRSILIHPATPSVMWLGSVSGGIWKTTDAGVSWAPMNDFMASLTIGCMAIDPFNPDVLYAGTGEGFFSTAEGSSNTAAIQGAGIFRSKDGGSTWVQIPSTAGPEWHFVNRIAVDPNDPLVILAATGSGIFRSADGGDRWSQRTSTRTLDLQFHPFDSQKAVAGRADGVAQFSTDGGWSWSNASGISNATRVELRYSRSVPENVYASITVTGEGIKIWKSTDGGQSYFLKTSGSGINTYALYNNVLWVHPFDDSFLVYGGVNLYRSTTGGQGYFSISGGHADYHALVEHPSFDGTGNKTLFVGNDGGIYRIPDIAASSPHAQELNNQLGITQFYGGAVNPTSGVALGGTQDNGTLRYGGNPEGWTKPLGADGGYCASDPTDPNYFYGETQNLKIYRSSDGGNSMGYIGWGIAEPSPNFIAPFILDPNDPNRMLAGGASLWRSNNVKAPSPTWTSVKPPLSCLGGDGGGGGSSDGDHGESHFASNPPCNISAIAVAPGNPDLVWVGHNDGDVYRSTDGTAAVPTWTKMDDNPPGLPDRWCGRIAVDPNNSQRVYTAFLGYLSGNVWKSEDGGLSWQDASGVPPFRLPDIPVGGLAIHQTQAGWVYAGTDLGVFSSEDGGKTWSTSDSGPANVATDELVWKNARTLLAVTHGRGMYLGETFDDCNDNYVPDFEDIGSGTSQDCNENGFPDECDLASGSSQDLNGDQIPDECQLAQVLDVGGACGSGPPLLAAGPPVLGSNWGVSLSLAAAGARGWLFFAQGPPAPWDFGGGCIFQLARGGLIFTVGLSTDPAGNWSTQITIPNDLALVGYVATGQAVTIVPGGPLLGKYELSNGLRLTLGF